MRSVREKSVELWYDMWPFHHFPPTYIAATMAESGGKGGKV
jgi:hypothetical protein